VMHREQLAVAVGKLGHAFVDNSLAVPLTHRGVALASLWLAHENGPRGTAGDFATVFEFVAFADRGFHFKGFISI
jgi:hypothetical protein